MLKKILGTRQSTASLSDNRKLILSLENALTPVMWVIDLEESPSILFKVTETDEGHFVLQKLVEGTKGRTVEDLAFYNKKAHAVNAMDQAATALKNGATKRSNGFTRVVRFIINTLAILIVLSTIAILFRLDGMVMNWLSDNETSAISGKQTQPNDMPIQPSSNPNDVGVPLSADDFFNNQGGDRNSGLPF